MENNCLFCEIAAKKIKAEVFYEDKNTVAFLDIYPVTEGHALVIPKKHSENIIDTSEENIAFLFKTVKKATAILKEKLNPKGFTIGINHGKNSGQIIDHIHVHIIPRYENDKGKSIHSIIESKTKKPVSETIKKITKTC